MQTEKTMKFTMNHGEKCHVLFDVGFSLWLLVPRFLLYVSTGPYRTNTWMLVIPPPISAFYPLFTFSKMDMEHKDKSTLDLMHCICAGDGGMVFRMHCHDDRNIGLSRGKYIVLSDFGVLFNSSRSLPGFSVRR
jgi:hypothetical protein